MWYNRNFRLSYDEWDESYDEIMENWGIINGQKKLDLSFSKADLKKDEYSYCVERIDNRGESLTIYRNSGSGLVYVEFGDGDDSLPLDEISHACMEAIRLKLAEMAEAL